ncbi:MAG: alpha-mannosidase [Chloroflexia bacterium]
MVSETVRSAKRGTKAPKPAKQFDFWVVPHTHWDREWYMPFEDFQMRLAVTVDEVLDVLEKDPTFSHFTLDGQSIVLEDYLEIRPWQEERLRRLLASGRMEAGPFYVLPDTYLVGQEALVRNVMIGRQVCERYGGSPMEVWYEPDTFGHIAQTPQLANGLGIKSFMFSRGLGDEAEELGAVFSWEGPDGSRVLAVRQLDGYGNAAGLGYWTGRGGEVGDVPELWPQAAVERIGEIMERYGKQLEIVGMKDVLLCNGTDHRAIQGNLPGILAECRDRMPGASFKIATFTQYVKAISEYTTNVKTYQGELCGGREQPVLRGVNSTRIYLKQANEAAEQALGIAETLAALASMKHRARGGGEFSYRYPAAELNHAWRKVLANHPHDSICGCSVDEVHEAMMHRYQSARLVIKRIKREAKAALAGTKERYSYREAGGEAQSLANTLPWSRTRAVELLIPPGLEDAKEIVAETESGIGPVQVTSREGETKGIAVFTVPGMGTSQVRLRACKGDPAGSAARTCGPKAIENEFYRVEAGLDGTLSVLAKRTGEVFQGLHYLEDRTDRGDEYNFSPLEGESTWDSREMQARVRVKSGGPVVAELQIELTARLGRALTTSRKGRSKDIVACPISTRVRLAAGVDRIEFETTVTNRAHDHRLRVLFPAPGSGQEVRVEGHFAMLTRSAKPAWSGRGWYEPPAETHHMLGTATSGKLALMTRGLPEYEAVPNDAGGVDLALTLLRCVGWLSRDDLGTRPGHAGPPLETPGAQCQGSYTFQYAVRFIDNESDAALTRAGQDYRTDFGCGPAGMEANGLLEVEGEGFAFSTLKGAEDGKGVILRIYNPSGTPTEARVSGAFSSIHRCRLDEKHPQPVGPVVCLGGYEIVTLRLE